jgi:uncharacterized membrane protein YcaP (DUF421 family)
MADSSIEVFEITRILLASSPALFLAEVILRSALMFIFALIIMRFSGRRTIKQLTSFDLLLIIALGSAMGDPIIYPDVAVLWSIFGIGSLILFYRIQTSLVSRFPRYEDLTEGKPTRILTDGVLDAKELKKHTFTQDEIFLLLRNQGIRSLGEVEIAYLERNGSLSIFKFRDDKKKPGLPTISEDMLEEWNPNKTGEQVEKSGFYSCYKTGVTVRLEKEELFPDCEGNIWIASN